MQRLLIALPILLLIAGLAFGGGFYVYSGDNTPAPTVAADALALDDEAPLLDECSPLDEPMPELELEPTPEPEPETPIETKPEETEPKEETTNAWRTEIESKLAESGLSNEDMEKVRAELEKAIGQMEEFDKRKVTLSGTVVDYANAPVSGAQVYASYEQPEDTNAPKAGNRSRRSGTRSWRIAQTDEDGAWSGSFYMPEGHDTLTVNLWATSQVHMNGEPISLSVSVGETYEDNALAVKQGAGITGRVVDQDFVPVAGARVMAYAKAAEGSKRSRRFVGALKHATTDESGNFTIGGLQDGDYRVNATATGFRASDMPEISIVAGAPTQLATDVVLNRVTAVKVKLVCAERQPGGYASATFYDANGKSRRSGGRIDSDGYMLLANVQGDAIEFEVNVPGYEPSGRIPVTIYAGTHSDAGEVALVWTGLETTTVPTRDGIKDVESRGEDLDRALKELEKLKELKKHERK